MSNEFEEQPKHKDWSKPFTLAAAPISKVPLIFDITKGKVRVGEDDPEHGGTEYDLTHPSAIQRAGLATKNPNSRPAWIQGFFQSMGTYVQSATPHAHVDPKTGELQLGAAMSIKELKNVCSNLTWLYESQHRQNKEILVWIGEIILDYMARSPHDMTVEEAIESLGFLDRNNGVKWKLKTITKWVIVAQRIDPEIRQLPVASSYLCEAALFALPNEALKKIQFANCRDLLLINVAENPAEWSRVKFRSCMKELQEVFGVKATRNEGIGALRERLIYFYRIREEIRYIADTDARDAALSKVGMTQTDLTNWIYNVEAELIYRCSMEADPFDGAKAGDGLTEAARARIKALNTVTQ